MKPQPIPLTREVVLVGGGHTHALVLRAWGMKPVTGARLTLINPGPTAPYTGMLPGFVAGHYDRDALDIDLVRLAEFAGARIILGRADGIDRARKRVHIAGRGEIAYDVASIDIGIATDPQGIPGFSAHGLAAKPLGPFADRWTGFLAEGGPARIVVIGAGVGGVELSLAMAHAMAALSRRAEITLVDSGPALGAAVPGAARRLSRSLSDAGIAVIDSTDVLAVAAGEVALTDGRSLPSDLTIGVAGARPWRWLEDTGLALRDGFIEVGPDLRSLSDPDIFATGDCAHYAHAPRPKAGVFAVRAAPVLTANLRAALTGGRPRRFRPQGDYLKLVSLGSKRAMLEKWGYTSEGSWIWRWKDRIDRRFMEKLSDLSPMTPRSTTGLIAEGARPDADAAPYCAGCGAKVGATALGMALSQIQTPARADVEVPPGDDAALLGLGDERLVFTTDHLSAITADPWLMGRVAAVHSLGDIWAMGAAPQAAMAQITLPRLSPSLQAEWLREIMQGAAAVFRDSGATIAGGHTTMGSDLTIGFSLTGIAPPRAITRSGAKPGDALLLTRSLGSGTILAGAMRLAARGADVAACLEEMARPQIEAATALSGAHAMTDVTGFGLAGHLGGILEASGVGAEIDLDAVPFYAGAEALAERGVRSSIFFDNRAAAAHWIVTGESPREALLFDPQTSGGLLAALPETEARRIAERLCDMGQTARIIGRVTAAPPKIRLL